MTVPNDTPPAADQMSGTAADTRRGDHPNVGPVSGNRTPMVVTLSIVGVLVVMVMALVVASSLH